MSLFLSFFSNSSLRLFAVLFDCTLDRVHDHTFHPTFTVYRDIAILTTKSLDSILDLILIGFWHFSSLDSTLDCRGGHDSLK